MWLLWRQNAMDIETIKDFMHTNDRPPEWAAPDIFMMTTKPSKSSKVSVFTQKMQLFQLSFYPPYEWPQNAAFHQMKRAIMSLPCSKLNLTSYPRSGKALSTAIPVEETGRQCAF